MAPTPAPPATDTPTMTPKLALLMLVLLTSGFALSQAFRTVASVMAPPLQADWNLSPQALGLFSGMFHFAFGALQLLMGIGIDLYGLRRTILTAFPLAIAGAALSSVAPSFQWLVLGQVLIGIGCAPAFLVCTVFIARHFPAQRFAAISGIALALGSLGMLFTGTPLAWLVEHTSWRVGFGVLAGLSALAWLVIWAKVHEPTQPVAQTTPNGTPAQRESIGQAVRRFTALLAVPHTWGIVALGWVAYAALISLRGLWMGPMLIERHGFSLVTSGHVALVLSIVALFGPMVFGRLDPGPATRRRWLLIGTFSMAGLFAVLALLTHWPWLDAAVMVVIGLVSGYMVLQYADVRSAYPPDLTGRAMALFTMSMFLGVAAMQWVTGWVASLAKGRFDDPYQMVMGSIALMLVLGALAFHWLPKPPSNPDEH